MKPQSRLEAKAAGLKRYFTGLPCLVGHKAERYVSNYRCVECHNSKKRCRKRRYYTRSKEQERKRYHGNYKRRLRVIMGTNIRNSLRGSSKGGKSWQSVLGYTTEQLRLHLEIQFQKGMTWENYGAEWHIDHRIPLASFNYTSMNDQEFKQAWALTNLQPLWAKENINKSNKVLFLL